MSSQSFYQFPNIGYSRRGLTQSELQPVWNEVNQLQSDFDKGEKFNQELAGNIQKEFLLINSFSYIENLLIADAKNFVTVNNYDKDINVNNTQSDLGLMNCWVNFQRKHEFNPSHNHAGVISFVIWMKIPYTADEEKTHSPGKLSNTNVPGHFEFLYTDTVGQIKSLLIACDKTMDGTVLMFPSKMVHAVYPFYTTDDYRITVSGNFGYNIN